MRTGRGGRLEARALAEQERDERLRRAELEIDAELLERLPSPPGRAEREARR